MIKLRTILFICFFVSAQFSHAENIILPSIDDHKEDSGFSRSLAKYVSGIVLEQGSEVRDGELIDTSVIWIPTYYGYHNFLGVLDNYIIHHTSITTLRTWRMADRNYYVINLGKKDFLINIIYDSRNSLLMLSHPPGY